jgi:predicted HTH domain antitoxin
MRIEIPDALLNNAHLSEQDLKLELALIFYQRNNFTLGQVSAFAGIHQIEFQKILSSRNINLHYDLDSFRDDLNVLNEP